MAKVQAQMGCLLTSVNIMGILLVLRSLMLFNIFFDNGYMLKSFHHTFIALIPKRDNPSLVEYFKPIFICNVVYKIITKILADRFKTFP